MQTIDIRFMRLEDAAALLVANAPARGDYWGTTMRAKYATTRPADLVTQYRRTISERAASYGNRLPESQRARLVCGACGAKGCKMWREYNTCADYTKVLCGRCTMADQKKTGTLDADGKWDDERCGKCDQIGWMVPAVPTHRGDTFWGYTSVPADGCEWWRRLPTYGKPSPRFLHAVMQGEAP